MSRIAEQIAMVATHQAESIALTTTAIGKLDDGIGALSSQGATLTSGAREASVEATSGTLAVAETASTIGDLKTVSMWLSKASMPSSPSRIAARNAWMGRARSGPSHAGAEIQSPYILDNQRAEAALRQNASSDQLHTLGSGEYGFDIAQVQEINRMVTITHVPQAAQFMEGVINLRGQLIPIIDLRTRFGMERSERTKNTKDEMRGVCTTVVRILLA